MNTSEIYSESLPSSAIKIIKKLDTPEKIQSFLDKEILFNAQREDRPIEEVLRDRVAECYTGSLFALACLKYHNYSKAGLVMLFHMDDEEHFLAVYQKNGKWGSIAKSKFLGLRSRHPIYLTIRDLTVSYKELYFRYDGRFSLGGHSRYFSLDEYNYKWLYDKKVMAKIESRIMASRNYKVSDYNEKPMLVAPDRYWREVLYLPNGEKVPKKYLKYKQEHFHNTTVKQA